MFAARRHIMDSWTKQKNKGTCFVPIVHTDKDKEDQSWEMFGNS